MTGANPAPLAFVLVLVAGCTFRSYETRQVARTGYADRPKVALWVRTDNPGFAARIVTKISREIPMNVVDTLVSVNEGSSDQQLCVPRADAAATDPPAARTSAAAPSSPPSGSASADVIVVVRAYLAAAAADKCDDLGWIEGTGKFTYDRDTGMVDFGWGTLGCKSRVYDYSYGWTWVELVALDRATCEVVDQQSFSTDEFTPGVTAASGSREDNDRRAKAGAEAAFLAQHLAKVGRDFLPVGLAATTSAAGRVAFTGPGIEKLRVGQYVVRSPRGPMVRLRIDQRTPSTATGVLAAYSALEDNPPTPALHIGDRVFAFSHPHEWRLIPLAAATVVSRGNSRRMIGGGIGLRWHYPRAYLYGEATASYHLGATTRRDEESVGLGLRLPVGPVTLYSAGELGRVGVAVTTESADRNGAGLLRGLGGGAEAWIGKTLFVVELRHRWTINVDDTRSRFEDARSWTGFVGLGAASK